MFDGVARRYDITSTVLSFGQDRSWRKLTRAALNLRPGEKVLDLAAGTGVSTVELAHSGAWCVATYFSKGMMHAGSGRPVPMVVGDAMHLPYADRASPPQQSRSDCAMSPISSQDCGRSPALPSRVASSSSANSRRPYSGLSGRSTWGT